MTLPVANRNRAFALVTVLIFTGLAVALLVGVLEWSSNSSRLNDRFNQYSTRVVVAEGALEKVVSRIVWDYLENDEDYVRRRLRNYRNEIPSKKENSLWAEWEIRDLNGRAGRLTVRRRRSWRWGDLPSQIPNSVGYYATYNVGGGIVQAGGQTSMDSKKGMIRVSQNVELAAIPLFSFMVFSFPDLEIAPDSSWKLDGRVHSNGDTYIYPTGNLALENLTAAGEIKVGISPSSVLGRRSGQLIVSGVRQDGLNTLNLALEGDHRPARLRELLEVPPRNESLNSGLGALRFYNQADLILEVDDKGVEGQSGPGVRSRGRIDWLEKKKVVSLKESFYDARENNTVELVEIDVERLVEQYDAITREIGVEPRIIYVDDQRKTKSDQMLGVRLVHAETLPIPGLTLVTRNPLYVQGNYNVDKAYRETSDTSRTRPSALIADAITVLSDKWDDKKGWSWMGFRKADTLTLNSAVMTCIAPTSKSFYSGGVENVFRLLEDWSREKFYFNGSIAILGESQVARAPWGSSWNVYEPPERVWTFDRRFLSSSFLPAGTPYVRTVFRGEWTTM